MNPLLLAIFATMVLCLNVETTTITKGSNSGSFQDGVLNDENCKIYTTRTDIGSKSTETETVTIANNGKRICTVEKCNDPTTKSVISCGEYDKVYSATFPS